MNLGDDSEEQGQRFHQGIKAMERRHQEWWDRNMMADFCWMLKREHAGKGIKRKWNPFYRPFENKRVWCHRKKWIKVYNSSSKLITSVFLSYFLKLGTNKLNAYRNGDILHWCDARRHHASGLCIPLPFTPYRHYRPRRNWIFMLISINKCKAYYGAYYIIISLIMLILNSLGILLWYLLTGSWRHIFSKNWAKNLCLMLVSL